MLCCVVTPKLDLLPIAWLVEIYPAVLSRKILKCMKNVCKICLRRLKSPRERTIWYIFYEISCFFFSREIESRRKFNSVGKTRNSIVPVHLSLVFYFGSCEIFHYNSTFPCYFHVIVRRMLFIDLYPL